MKKSLTIAIGFAMLLGACTKNLTDVNRNPNGPAQADPQFLLSNLLYQTAKNNAEEGWKSGNLLAQLTSNIEFFPIDRYDVGTNTELWNAIYRLLNDINTIRSSPSGNTAYGGVALVMRANLAALLTDLWNDVPYSQAIKGVSAGNFSPVYDSQEDVYTGPQGVLTTLDSAVQLLSATQGTINGDILYKGDLTRWIRFANSLKLRYLVRISAKTDVKAAMQTLVNEGMFFRGNEDNAVIPFLASAPNQWFLINEREGRYADVRMSKTAAGILVPLNDARIGVYYKPTAASSAAGDPAFKGLPNGLSRQSQNAYDLSDVSLIGSLFRQSATGVSAPLMTYTEVEFLLAEAASRGLIDGSAAAFYEEAIRSSHAYFGAALSAGYLSGSGVALDGSNDLQKIMTQKWISNFLNGYEAWIDVRRTGFPELPVPADNLNGNKFPVRFRYPATEQAANRINYEAAVQRIGGDTYDSKGWWEK